MRLQADVLCLLPANQPVRPSTGSCSPPITPFPFHHPPSASHPPSCTCSAAAEDAAHTLLEAAQKQWAVRYRGRNCDDCTVVVAFLHR